MENLNDQNIFSEDNQNRSDLPEQEEVFHNLHEEAAPEENADGTYRGVGAGRWESPYVDSPYVLNREPRRKEPVFSREAEYAYEDNRVQPSAKRKPKGIGRRILAAALSLILVAGSCGLTAFLVNSRWEDRVSKLESSFASQMQELKEQVTAMSPAYTGNSVSGSVTLENGLSASQIYAKNVRSVVLIESQVSSEFFGQVSTGVSTGSGFILTEDGYVVTNFHVIEGATAVKVVLHDGKSHPAEVIGYDSTNDIALLKMEAEGLDAVELGSSDELIVGDQVVAIGNPLGELTSTLTVGYVSAKERSVSTDGTVMNMIQTDAAINSGNSGGPLFNMKGQVVGITTAKYSGASSSGATIEGIGFAIPINDVLDEIDDLAEFGYIKSAYLGVMVQNMDPSVADIYGLPVGAYVAGVEEGFCAQKAGIQPKDIIVSVGDVTISTLSDLTRALRDYEPGERVKVGIYRAGQTLELTVVLDERPVGLD